MNRQRWGIEVKIALLQRGMSITELAKELGYSRQYVSDVVRNATDYPERDAVRRISDFLFLQLPEERSEE